MKTNEQRVALGRIGKPQGLRGELRLKLYNPDSDLLWQHEEWLLAATNGERLVRATKRRHVADDVVVIAIDGITSRDEAETLRGAEVMLDASLLPRTAEGEWYVRDLVGLVVFDPGGREIGIVLDTIDYPSVDCLLIKCEDERYEVPMVDPYLQDVDLDQRRVVVSDLKDLDPLPKRRKTSSEDAS